MSTEILKALDSVEAKLNSFNTQQIEIRDRLLSVEQKGGSMPGEFSTSQSTLGDQFLKSFDANRELLDKTGTLRLSVKVASDAVTTASGRNIVTGGVGVPGISQLGMQNALKTRSVPATSAIEYSRFLSVTGAAAQQVLEGDVKASIRPEHALIQQKSLTIAAITRMSRQALTDSAELKAAIDSVLTDSVQRALSTALGTGATGFEGYNVLASAFTSLTFTNLVDAVSETVATMQLNGFSPDTVVIGPQSWLAITTAIGTDGHYMTGDGMYLATVPQNLRGLKVVLSATVPSGKALVMDSRHSELLMIDNFEIELGYNADDFSRNLISVRGEVRVVPIYRTTGSAIMVSAKAAA